MSDDVVFEAKEALADSVSKEFNDSLLGDWDDLVERFFEKVEDQQERFNLTNGQVEEALGRGYGYEISDAWADWAEEEETD